MMEETGPIDADKLTGPLVFCTVSGGENGWFHCYVRTTGPTAEAAKIVATAFLERQFTGCRKVVREDPYGEESRDFALDIRIVTGGCRFAFMLEDGPTLQRESSDEIQYVGFAA